MIRSFKDKRTETVAGGRCPKGFPTTLVRSAVRKLTMLDSAVVLDDLRSPPGNRLEALKKDRKGQHSIRINDQWRICFYLDRCRCRKCRNSRLPLSRSPRS